jgi:CRP/FNR family transcriptional regulator
MLQQDNSETRKTMFFEGMPQDRCEVLEKQSELRTYPAGAVIHSQGDNLQGVLVVSKGFLKLVRHAGRDKSQVIDMARPGQCMGEVQLLTGMPAVASAVASGDTECWFIPAAVLLPMIKDDPVVAGAFLWQLSAKMGLTVSLIESLSLHTVPERVARLVLFFHREAPEKSFVEFRDTQEGLARHIGSSREAFNRGLKMLGDLGFVQNSFPVVHILDEARLRRFADGF